MSNRGRFSAGISEDSSYLTAVGAGKVPKVSSFKMNSRRTELSTTSFTPIIEFADTYVFPSNSGEAITAVSSSASDVGNVMEIVGLDTDFNYKRETFVLNGLTPVALGTWARINAVSTIIKEVVGSVTVAGANTYAVVPPDIQRSSLGVYSTPVGTRATVWSTIPSIIKVAGGGKAIVDGRIKFRLSYPVIGAFTAPFSYGLETDGTSSDTILNEIPSFADAPIDLLIEAEATTTGVSHYVRTTILMEELN